MIIFSWKEKTEQGGKDRCLADKKILIFITLHCFLNVSVIVRWCHQDGRQDWLHDYPWPMDICWNHEVRGGMEHTNRDEVQSPWTFWSGLFHDYQGWDVVCWYRRWSHHGLENSWQEGWLWTSGNPQWPWAPSDFARCLSNKALLWLTWQDHQSMVMLQNLCKLVLLCWLLRNIMLVLVFGHKTLFIRYGTLKLCSVSKHSLSTKLL